MPGGGEAYSRKDLDGLTEYASTFGAKGLVWLKVEAEALTGPTAKFFPADVQARLRERFDAKAGRPDPDRRRHARPSPARRSRTSGSGWRAELKLYDPKTFHYSWVVRFPLLAWDAEEGRYAAEHHPFTMPLPEDLHLLDTDPAKVRAQAYDLVINGEEGGGGTIRCHDPSDPVEDLRPAGPDPRAGRGEVRLPARRPQAAPRRTAASRSASTGWSCSTPA